MKATDLIRRRRRNQGAPRVVLFSFLAVLICTMGALVPVLFGLARQAKLSAANEAAALAAQRKAELDLEREGVAWRVEQLQAARRQTDEQLQQARLMLGHIEDHARRLREQAVGLRAQWESLQQSGPPPNAQREALTAEWQALQRKLAEAQQQLDEARRNATERPRSYAIIPYAGPNQTRRRPIYLECTASAVILQPEGIALNNEDFDGPLGPGNPLAAVLRAAREHLVTSGGFDPEKDGEPYPLLLVRPDGIVAYYAARAALKPWGADFGYELIGDDWNLTFPPRDPQLAESTRMALQQARVHQQRLIAAAPRHYGGARAAAARRELDGRGGPGGTGGTGGAGGMGAGGGIPGDTGSYLAATGNQVGRRFDDGMLTGGPGGPAGPAGSGGTGSAGSGGGPAGGNPDLASIYGGSATAGGTSGDAQGASSGAAGSAVGAAGGAASGTSSGAPSGGPSGGPSGAGGGAAGESCPSPASPGGPQLGSAGGSAAERPEGYVVRPPAGAAQDGQAGGRPLRPGEWQERPPPRHEDTRDEANDRHKRRGPDWGLPEASRRSAGIARPIRVDCYADRLVVAPSTSGQTIAWPGRADITGELIPALWAEIEQWGIAGKGMHWRPVLSVQVMPGGDARLDELQRQLSGSGIEVQRR